MAGYATRARGKKHDAWTEITAPYLDRNNDYLQIYLSRRTAATS